MEKLKCKVVMLTQEKSKFFNVPLYTMNDVHVLRGSGSYSQEHCLPQHLYFTSNKPLKKGDLTIFMGKVDRVKEEPKSNATSIVLEKAGLIFDRDQRSKIEASTDETLGVPLIGFPFVKKYVEKNGNINEVCLDQYMETTYKYGMDSSEDKVQTRADGTVIISKAAVEKNDLDVKEILDIIIGEADIRGIELKFYRRNLEGAAQTIYKRMTGEITRKMKLNSSEDYLEFEDQ